MSSKADSEADSGDSRDSQKAGRDPQRTGRDNQRPERDPQRTGRDSQRLERDPQRTGRDSQRLGRDPQRTGRDSQRLGRDPQRTGRDNQRLGRDPQRTGSGDNQRTLAARAEWAIRESILDGERPFGVHLRIEELAHELEMSAMPVREALRNLASTGFVEYLPHRGATVAHLSIEDLRDTWDARLALETVALRRAAERFADADREPVELSIARHTDALVRGDHPEARAAHREIHLSLYRPSGYNWLDRLVEPTWIRSERYRSVALRQRGTPEQLAAEHRQILDACAAQDPDAATELLYVHLVKTANILAERLVGAPLFDLSPPPSLGQVTIPARATESVAG